MSLRLVSRRLTHQWTVRGLRPRSLAAMPQEVDQKDTLDLKLSPTAIQVLSALRTELIKRIPTEIEGVGRGESWKHS